MTEPSKSADYLTGVANAAKGLVNPINLFAGAKIEDTLVCNNVVMFKRTSPEMLKPSGVTHNYHHRFVLIIPLVKSGRIHVDGTGYLLHPGHTYLIFPHQFHHFLDIHEEGMQWVFLTFECANATQIATLRNSPRIFGPDEGELLRDLLTSFLSTPPGPDRTFGLVFSVTRLIRKLRDAREADCTYAEPASADATGEILQKINNYVRGHLGETVQIADLARHTGYSRSYIRAVFRKGFGVSLGSYVRESRLSVAAAMLSDSNHGSIEEIARACGFDSISVFSRAFKKATGVPPSAYNSFVAKNGSGLRPR